MRLAIVIISLLLILGGEPALSQTQPITPEISIAIGSNEIQGNTLSAGIRIMLLLTAVSFAPAMLLTTTCFTRLVIVFSMTRTALGTQQAPPNMVLTGLALFLTIAIMGPVFSEAYNAGLDPYLEGVMSEDEAIRKGSKPIREFLLANTKQKDLALFLDITKSPEPESESDTPLIALIPAFVVSELNVAFQIGFLIALPFLVLDMVVSSVLTSMSMITLPPVVISLPLKLMLFVLVDGWSLIISSLVKTYAIP